MEDEPLLVSLDTSSEEDDPSTKGDNLSPKEKYLAAVEFCFKDDDALAVEYFTQAAEGGFLAADVWLYSMNTEDEQQKAKAVAAISFLLREENRDQPWAQNDLGYCYENGLGCEEGEPNLEKAIRYYEAAAAQGHKFVSLNLCHIYSAQEKINNLRKFFLHAKQIADSDYPQSQDLQYYVARCFQAGEMLDPNTMPDTEDTEVNRRHSLEQTLQTSDENGINLLEEEKQEDFKRDLFGAFKYYKKASEARGKKGDQPGHPDAQYRLGLLYETGFEDKKKNWYQPPNQRLARSCFQNAAKQGHGLAQPKAQEETGNKVYNANFLKTLTSLNQPLSQTFSEIERLIELKEEEKRLKELLKKLESQNPVSEPASGSGEIKTEEVQRILGKLGPPPTFDEVQKTTRRRRAGREVNSVNQRIRELNLGVLTAAKECRIHPFNVYFGKTALQTTEENLLAALCHSQGISSCEKDQGRAMDYYKTAYNLASASKGLTKAAIDAARSVALNARTADGNEIQFCEPDATACETIANTLLYELLNYYKEIAETDRTGLEKAEQDKLNEKEAALKPVILRLSDSMTRFLEQPTDPRTQENFLSAIHTKNIPSCLDDDMTFWPIIGNIAIILVGGIFIGLAAMAINYAVNDRFLFFKTVMDGKVDTVAENMEEICPMEQESFSRV